MPLEYEFVNVHDWQQIPPRDRMDVVWASLMVNLGEITEKNADKFAARWLQVQHPALDDPGEEMRIYRLVHRCVGFWSNVCNMRDTSFSALVKRRYEHRIRRLEALAIEEETVRVDEDDGDDREALATDT